MIVSKSFKNKYVFQLLSLLLYLITYSSVNPGYDGIVSDPITVTENMTKCDTITPIDTNKLNTEIIFTVYF